MKIVVTGRNGQIARALTERGPLVGAEVVCIGRPVLDLSRPDLARKVIADTPGDVIVNAAAYTAVDQAERDVDEAMRINRDGAQAVAAAAAKEGRPLIQISTDYVFDGTLDRPWNEDDAPNPINVYGRSKYEGERAAAAVNPDCVILRTAWVFSPFGRNFLRTVLHLAHTHRSVRVVEDQFGAPTSAFDLADGIIAVAARVLKSRDKSLRGIFHMTGAGEASWADMAEFIFVEAAKRGRKPVEVERIPSGSYPTAARRPANSRLDGRKLERVYGIRLPHWRVSLSGAVVRCLFEDPSV